MHPHIAAVLARFDEAHTTFQAAVHIAPPEAWVRRPEEGRWSIVEILEHVSLVEAGLAARLAAAIAEGRAAGLHGEDGERLPLPSPLVQVLEDRTTRRDAPEGAHPSGTLSPAAAWEAVERSRADLRQVLIDADGLALSKMTYSHPFFGALTPYQWMELIAGHRERHTAQVREVLSAFEETGG